MLLPIRLELLDKAIDGIYIAKPLLVSLLAAATKIKFPFVAK
jgi:hypothetical protein